MIRYGDENQALKKLRIVLSLQCVNEEGAGICLIIFGVLS